MRYLDIETVVAINKSMTRSFGGAFGIRDRGLLKSAIAQLRQTFCDIDLYPSVVDKAARLAYGITTYQPFIDGNKRTAAACAAAFLEMNDYSFEPPKGELAETFIALAAGEIDSNRFKEWICFKHWMSAYAAARE